MALAKLGNKAVGSIIKIKENGVPQEYIAVQHGKPSAIYDDSFIGVTILLRKNVYESRQWHNSNVNDYAGSTIHSHLNSTFFGIIDSAIRDKIVQVKILYRPGSGTSMGVNSGVNGLATKVFLLSGYEVGFNSSDNQYMPVDGARFSYFENNSRIADTYWWLRSPFTYSSASFAFGVFNAGSAAYNACSQSYGIRPALALPSDLLIDDDGNVVPYKPGTLGEQDIGATAKVKIDGVYRDIIVLHKGSPSALYYGFEDCVVVMLKEPYENRQWHTTNLADYADSGSIHSYLNGAFLNLIEQDIRNAIKQVKIPYRPGGVASQIINSGANGLSAKVFLLSGYEVGWTNSTDKFFPVDGTCLSYFAGTAATDAKRIAYFNGTAAIWWLRSPRNMNTGQVWYVHTNGNANYDWCSYSHDVRPAFVLPSNAIVNADGTLSFNQPPTDPGPITYSGKARAGKEITITCEGSTDPEGDNFVYYWEWRTDTGVYQQLGITTEPTITVAVPTSGTLWQVRVKAVDEKGGESGWRTGTAITISYNDPPAISDDTDGSLGDLTDTGLSYAYTVTDDKDASIPVTVAIDGKTIRTLTVPTGQRQTFTLTEEEWQQTLNGTHTLTVTAKDADGESATRNVTFSRNQTRLAVAIKNPKPIELRPTRMSLNLSAAIPAGAVLQILACNNALDDSPAWEDITQSVAINQTHIFSNETKTAENWAVNVLIKVDRNGAAGDCYVTGFAMGWDTALSVGVPALMVTETGVYDALMSDGETVYPAYLADEEGEADGE